MDEMFFTLGSLFHKTAYILLNIMHVSKNGPRRRRRQPRLLGAQEGNVQSSPERADRKFRGGMPERGPGEPFQSGFSRRPSPRRERDRPPENHS